MFEKPYSKYEYNDAVLSGLLSIALASLTQLLLKSPNIFMNVRQDVPREILVHEEHTGAWRCSAATADWTAIRIANLIFVYLVAEEYIPCTDKQVYGHETHESNLECRQAAQSHQAIRNPSLHNFEFQKIPPDAWGKTGMHCLHFLSLRSIPA